MFGDDMNNVMVMNKLIKNVLIRWDADFNTLRPLFGWSKDPANLVEERTTEVEAEVVLVYAGTDSIKIRLPLRFILKEIDDLRKTTMGRWINHRHPTIGLYDVKKLKNDHLQNSTIGFYWGGSTNSAENKPMMKVHVGHMHVSVNQIQVRAMNNVQEYKDCFRQRYAHCTEM